jgi:gp16 family phage-associated protein
MGTAQTMKPHYVWTPSGPVLKSGQVRTVADFLSELESKNLTLASWARDTGMDMQVTYMVSRGRCTGRRGKARDVMKAMGVEVPPTFQASRAAKTAGTAQ